MTLRGMALKHTCVKRWQDREDLWYNLPRGPPAPIGRGGLWQVFRDRCEQTSGRPWRDYDEHPDH